MERINLKRQICTLDNCNKNFIETKFHKGVCIAFNKEIERWCPRRMERWWLLPMFFGKLTKFNDNSTTIFRTLFYFIR